MWRKPLPSPMTPSMAWAPASGLNLNAAHSWPLVLNQVKWRSMTSSKAIHAYLLEASSVLDTEKSWVRTVFVNLSMHNRCGKGSSEAPHCTLSAYLTTVISLDRVKKDSHPSSVTKIVSEIPQVLSPSTPHIQGIKWKVMPGLSTVSSPCLRLMI